MVEQIDVLGIVQIADFSSSSTLDCLLRSRTAVLDFSSIVKCTSILQMRNDLRSRSVLVGRIVFGTGDNERRTRFIDQDRVALHRRSRN